MGKRGGWFSAVKKALGAETKEKKDQVWMVIYICVCVCVCVLFSFRPKNKLLCCLLQLELFPIISTEIRL